ncbi:MAG: hypothetical protein AAFZ17_18900 [Cyanobacteria bacterium J06650_10]
MSIGFISKIRIRQYVTLGLITVLSFGMGTSLLSHIIPSSAIPQNLPIIGTKYAYYQAHKDDYNTLFFGSSRIYHHIDPATFDTVTQRANIVTHSFNFGVAGLKPLHNYALLQEILKNPPKNLKWVFIEDALDQGSAPLDEVRTDRAIYWHTRGNTIYSLRFVLSHPDTSLSQKVTYSLSHLLPFIYHTINLGRVFDQWLPMHHLSEEDRAIAAQFLTRAGYRPIDFDMPKRQYFLSNLEQYTKEVDQLAKKKKRITYQEPLPPVALSHLQNIVTTVTEAGATPIFVVAPTTIYQETIHRAYHQQHIARLLSFNDPNQYPQLFDTDSRTDWDHLTPESAEVFTQLLAEKFVQTTELTVAETNPSSKRKNIPEKTSAKKVKRDSAHSPTQTSSSLRDKATSTPPDTAPKS